MGLRLVMMGTGRFAVPTFRALCESKHRVLALFTQPDRSGRGHHRHRNPMKEIALERGIPVFQPERVRDADVLQDLARLEPDLCVVAAYGQILPKQLLEIPRLGAINVHASLLPRYRGAAPVVYALLEGEKETGVTIFRIEPALDSGPMLASVRTPIRPKETAGELEARLAELAAPLVVDVVDRLEQGTIEETPQDDSQATYAPRLTKQAGLIDWSQPAAKLERHVRAMQPWPKAYTFLKHADQRAKRVIVLDVEPVPLEADWSGAEPGTVVHADSRRIVVRTGDGAVEIRSLQPEGARRMRTDEFLCGHRVQAGDRFVREPEPTTSESGAA